MSEDRIIIVEDSRLFNQLNQLPDDVTGTGSNNMIFKKGGIRLTSIKHNFDDLGF